MSVSIRTLATLAVAMFLGLVSVIMVRSYISHAVQPMPVETGRIGQLVPVVVAAQPLTRGMVLQGSLLKVVNYPLDAAPAESFHAIANLTGGKDQQRLVLRSLVANEPLLPANISGPGGKLNLSGTVAAGMRAVSLRSNDVSGVGGFVLPGDRVDVMLTRTTSGDNNKDNTVAQILAENVLVLGVDQLANDETDKPVVARAITVEVTPEQAQSISLGQSVGSVSLTLRHVADDAPLARKSMSVTDLGPTPRKKVAAEPQIHIVRGTQSTRVSFGTSLPQTEVQSSTGKSAP